jgi:colanic acid/amylovoran biosynthesis glycosyltransferase
VALRLAFINTRMPGMTFLARDICALLDAGIGLDLYLFEVEDLDPGIRRMIETSGGRIEKIDFPMSGAILTSLLGEIVCHPLRLAGSLLIGLETLLSCPAEGIRALGVLPAALALGRKLRQGPPVQVHGLWAGVPTTMAYWISRHGGLPYSFSGHAWDITGRTAMLSRKVAACCSMVVCSQFAQEIVRRKCPPALHGKVHLVHHGLDLSRWSFAPASAGAAAAGASAPVETPAGAAHPARIISVGRLTPKKGYEILIEACGLLQQQGMSFSCEIIGPDAGVEAGLREQIRRLGLEERVLLSGERPESEVLHTMRGADCLACASVRTLTGDSDGIPNAVLEAMAVGLPVVTTDAGGLLEVVHQGTTGLLVPQRDPVALARALQAVLTDRSAALARAQNARRLLEDSFATETTARHLLSALDLAGSLTGTEGGTRVRSVGF